MGDRKGQTLQSRYRIETALGQGGMGNVYRAMDTRLDVLVAIKEMIPQSDLDAKMLDVLRTQFRQEAVVLARLKHPNLVRVSDFFEERSNAYLVMDFVEGESLAERIKRDGQQDEKRVLTWAEQLLDALAYCHTHNIIHRDIKPQNVILCPDGQAVLVDFGLVKLWNPDDPQTKTVMRGMGTPEYAPPEQYDAQMGHTDPRSDIYSLGATLYHALVGDAPPTATIRIADPERFEHVWQGIEGVSEKTHSGLLKSLELARSQRWSDAFAMADGLGLSIKRWEPLDVGGAVAKPAAGKSDGTRKMDGSTPASEPLPSEPKEEAAVPKPAPARRFPVWIWGLLVFVVLGTGVGGGFASGLFEGLLASPTPTPTATATATLTPTPSATPTATATSTPSPIPTPTPVPISLVEGPEDGTRYSVDRWITIAWTWPNVLEENQRFVLVFEDAEGNIVFTDTIPPGEALEYGFMPRSEGFASGDYTWTLGVVEEDDSGALRRVTATEPRTLSLFVPLPTAVPTTAPTPIPVTQPPKTQPPTQPPTQQPTQQPTPPDTPPPDNTEVPPP